MITGGPTAGKKTLAKALAGDAIELRATDSLIETGWGEDSAIAAHWLDMQGPWILYGVAMGRALRKWMSTHPEGEPADLVVYLKEPAAKRSPGQAVMAAGCETIFEPLKQQLIARGTLVIEM